MYELLTKATLDYKPFNSYTFVKTNNELLGKHSCGSPKCFRVPIVNLKKRERERNSRARQLGFATF